MASNIEELTECVVCAEPFKDPQSLPCLHTFCKRCVDRIKKGPSIKCPTCNTQSEISALRANFNIQKISEALSHAVVQALAKTTLKPGEDRKPAAGEKCHLCCTNPMAHFCEDCSQWMCDLCKATHLRSNASKNHRFKTVSEKAIPYKTELQTHIDKIIQIETNFQEAIRKCQAGVDDTNGVQVDALKTLKKLRKICEQEMKTYFETTQETILKFTSGTSSEFELEATSLKSQLKDLTQKRKQFQESAARSDNKIAIEGESLIEKAKNYLQIVESPDIDIQLPVVNIQRDLRWTNASAVTLDMSGEKLRQIRSGLEEEELDADICGACGKSVGWVEYCPYCNYGRSTSSR